ncbi:MAG: putative hydro-lyase [Alphaproteobacteria bacterium]
MATRLQAPHERPEALSGVAARALIRAGRHTGHTAGLAPGHVQGNLAILPRDWAEEFLRFCQQNPKPCPLLGVSEPGSPALPTLGADIDIRRDIGRYRVFIDGQCVDEPETLDAVWRDDLVAFVLGCSFSFEAALLEDGLRLRHIERNLTVPMFRTTIETVPTRRFKGGLVVSMRPFKPADAIRAIQITSRFPAVHGAPVHVGLPEMIGIKDIAKPDFGDALEVGADELPVFWACGVTPQNVVAAARPPLFIAHYPGCMLVTDLSNSKLAAL